METKDTCLYIHTRKSDGGIFYVGIGSIGRPYSKNGRNNFWKKVVKKHGLEVTILKTNMSWKYSCDLEIKMISFYGRIKPSKNNLNYGCLVNMTDGGDGTKGLIQSEDTKKKIKQTLTGKFIGENSPRFGFIVSEETKQKMRKPKSEEHKSKLRKPRSNQSKKNIKENQPNRSGEKNPKAKKIICSITGKIYGCIKDASKDVGINYNTLYYYLTKTPNKTSLRFV